MKLVTIPYVVDQILEILHRKQEDYPRVARTLRLAMDGIGLAFFLPLRTDRLTLDAQLSVLPSKDALDITKVGLITSSGTVEQVNLVANNIDFRVKKLDGCTCPQGYVAGDPVDEDTFCPVHHFFNYLGGTPLYGYTQGDMRKKATVDTATGRIYFDATFGVSEGRNVLVEYTAPDRNNAGEYVVRRDAVEMLMYKTAQLIALGDDPAMAGEYERLYLREQSKFRNRISRSGTPEDMLAALRSGYSATVPNL